MHFSSVCVLQVRVSSHLKLVFKVPPALLRFMDEIHCNPNLRVYRDDASGLFTVEFAAQKAEEVATHEFELMKFILKNKFPVDRVPLRLVPSVLSALQYQVVYEMNPAFESIAVLRLAVVCRPVDAGTRVVSATCEKGKTTKVLLEGGVQWNATLGLLECVVNDISKDTRRDRLTFTVVLDKPGLLRWGGVSCEFDVSKSLLPNMSIALDREASSDGIDLLGGRSICHRYYATH